MKKEIVPERYDFQLREEYWNNGCKDTFATKTRISPKKDAFYNAKGAKKQRELTSGKIYEGVEVSHRPSRFGSDRLAFYCYVVRNDFGQIARYYERGMFMNSSNLREKRLKDILE